MFFFYLVTFSLFTRVNAEVKAWNLTFKNYAVCACIFEKFNIVCEMFSKYVGITIFFIKNLHFRESVLVACPICPFNILMVDDQFRFMKPFWLSNKRSKKRNREAFILLHRKYVVIPFLGWFRDYTVTQISLGCSWKLQNQWFFHALWSKFRFFFCIKTKNLAIWFILRTFYCYGINNLCRKIVPVRPRPRLPPLQSDW